MFENDFRNAETDMERSEESRNSNSGEKDGPVDNIGHSSKRYDGDGEPDITDTDDDGDDLRI